MTQEELLSSNELQSQLIDRVEVLDKVKRLLLIPQTDLMTVKQVASYYEVDRKVIEQIYIRNSAELKNDGICLKSYKDFLNLHHVGIEKTKGKSTFLFKDGEILEIPNRGLKVFPRRAILRIGMLLRDSDIAKEIRTQLLNIEETASNPTKVKSVNEELDLMLGVGKAYASGNPDTIMLATTKMMGFKNRHIDVLETTNKALAEGILEWEDRSNINFAIRKLSQFAHVQYGKLWNELYTQLKNKFHMDLKIRGKQPWIQYVNESEWSNVIKCFSALCKFYGTEPTDMFHKM